MHSSHFKKPHRDALLIIHFEIDRPIDKADIDWLLEFGFIAVKHGGGWMTSSKGRRYLQEIIRR